MIRFDKNEIIIDQLIFKPIVSTNQKHGSIDVDTTFEKIDLQNKLESF